MKVLSIEAGREQITFRLEGAAGERLFLRESAPVVGAKPGRTLSTHECAASGAIALRASMTGSIRNLRFSRAMKRSRARGM